MAAQTPLLSLEDFQHRFHNRKPAFEYRQGEAVQKSSPAYLHALIQSLLLSLLQGAGWIAVPELRLKLNPGLELVPDIIAARTPPDEPYSAVGPELCIEILSPDDRLSQLLRKAKSYIAHGSESVWIIDPVQQVAWIVTADQTAWIKPGGTLSIAETRIALTELFNRANKLRKPQVPEDRSGEL